MIVVFDTETADFPSKSGYKPTMMQLAYAVFDADGNHVHSHCTYVKPPEAVDVSPATPDSQGAPVVDIERSVRYILANGGKVRRNGAENTVIFEHGGEKCSVPLAQAEQTKWMKGGGE